MLTHDLIWTAIDALATRQGLTPSSLAKLAGLDPTTFNRSKRKSVDGNPRWPSTESIAKILAATNVSVDDFLALMKRDQPNPDLMIPFRMMDTLVGQSIDASGTPQGTDWEHIQAPGSEVQNVFALGICGDDYAPWYRDGDVILLSPVAAQRRGDRVLTIKTDGSVCIAVLWQCTTSQVHFRALNGDEMPPKKPRDIKMMARILWVSQ